MCRIAGALLSWLLSLIVLFVENVIFRNTPTFISFYFWHASRLSRQRIDNENGDDVAKRKRRL
jgi:ABC-type amino acid transport system permease subunit